ncbi:MAG: DUF547 domain-containing protein [Thermodesulfobacteriota bacterium]
MREKVSKVGIISLLVFFLLMIFANPFQSKFTIISHGIEEVNNQKFDQSYVAYNKMLSENVKDSLVNYQGFIDSKAEFEAFLNTFGSVEPTEFNSWSEKEQLAFWINAYNAFTIKAIIDHYPIERSFSLVGIFYAPSNSILQIKGVWKKLEFKAVGRMVTLDEIEHEILRKEFNEPRIHMAIVCASISCPDLSPNAYTADKIEEQLTQASIDFINNPEKGVSIDQKDGRVKLSKIFKWFGDDFIPNYGTQKLFNHYSLKENAVLNFAADYLQSDEQKEYLMTGKLKIGYLGYDWNLNEQTPSSS